MRRLVAIIAVMVLSLSSISNAAINFAGVEWLSKPSQVIKIMNDKSYALVDVVSESGATDFVFSGKISISDARFVFRFDLEEDLVQVTIVTDELDDPAQMYQSLKRSLNEKYGDSTEGQDKRSAQFENIGSQTQLSQGIRLGEVYWQSEWEDEVDLLRMETLKGGLVRLDYYSAYWDTEYERRRKGKTDDL